MRKDIGMLDQRGIWYPIFSGFLKLIKSFYGWRYIGDSEDVTREVNVDYDTGHVRESKNVKTFAWFERPSIWKWDPITWILEKLTNIIDLFRRLAVSVLPLLVVLAVIMLIIGETSLIGDLAKLAGIIYGIFYGVELVLGLLGFIFTKLFKKREYCNQMFDDYDYKLFY